jgi:hypothetical protein
VVASKLGHGAYIAVAAMAGLFALMQRIRKHYQRLADEITVADGATPLRPASNHAIVLVGAVTLPVLRALGYAKATRPTTLEAVTVAVDPEDTELVQAAWTRHEIDVPLKILDSPYREITRPVVDYVKNVRRRSPRDVVTVFIPEYVVGRWWEHLLHNQSALRLKGHLLFQPGVMVTSVPWQLRSSGQRDAWNAGTTRRRTEVAEPLSQVRCRDDCV